MWGGEVIDRALAALRGKSRVQAECVLTVSDWHDFKAENGNIYILRSSCNQSLSLSAVSRRRKATAVIGETGREAVSAAAVKLLKDIDRAPADPANDIAPYQEPGEFERGPETADLEGMHRLMRRLIAGSRAFPRLRFGPDTRFRFVSSRSVFANSNGVRFCSRTGHYELFAVFSSREGTANSSKNGVMIRRSGLDFDPLESGNLSELFRQSGESVHTTRIKGKFEGDILVAPECLASFLSFITENALRDSAIISGTSPYKNKLGQRISNSGLTLSSLPLSPGTVPPYFVTPDGHRAENMVLIENGRLKSCILSRYASARTGRPHIPNAGGCYSVEPGKDPLKSILRGIKKGLLVSRFSGGAPNVAGDFSGVAKNSFYIENGRVRYPVSEAMISGNIPAMLMKVRSISKERVDYGGAVYPWMSFGGVTVSGG